MIHIYHPFVIPGWKGLAMNHVAFSSDHFFPTGAAHVFVLGRCCRTCLLCFFLPLLYILEARKTAFSSRTPHPAPLVQPFPPLPCHANKSPAPVPPSQITLSLPYLSTDGLGFPQDDSQYELGG